MTLYQRVDYMKPDTVVPIIPQNSGGGSLGFSTFRGPGCFTYNTYEGPGHFNVTEQGLVGLMASDDTPPWGTPYANAGYRIFTKSDGTMDVLPFMEAMASLGSYGVADEGKTNLQLLELIKSRPVEMRCGFTTIFNRYCASLVGINTRQVHMLNVTQPNYYDDGHVFLEAMMSGKWVAFDVPNDFGWLHPSSGDLLSIAEVIERGVENCEPRLLAPHRVGRSEYSIFPNTQGVFYERMFRSEQMLLDWCKRIYEVPGMSVPGGIVWGLPAHLWGYKSYIESYPGTNGSWTVMPFDDWKALYY